MERSGSQFFNRTQKSGPYRSEKEMAVARIHTRCQSNEQKKRVPTQPKTHECDIAFLYPKTTQSISSCMFRYEPPKTSNNLSIHVPNSQLFITHNAWLVCCPSQSGSCMPDCQAQTHTSIVVRLDGCNRSTIEPGNMYEVVWTTCMQQQLA